MADINIYGKLIAKTADGIVTDAESVGNLEAEEWEFTLKDGTTVTKLVYTKPTSPSEGDN